MVTSIPHVRVAADKAGGGFTARCSACSWSILRPSRLAADVAGNAHQRVHATPNPADQIPEA